jgi:magnesium transporter
LIKHFQVSFSEALFLLTFVPVIMGMGGNVGSQTSTLAVRGLATGHVVLGEGRARRFVFQQVRIGAALGVICAGLAAVGAYVLEGVLDFSDSSTFSVGTYSGIVGAALFLAILVASCNGAIIPLLFKRLGVDPAVAAGPLVSTLNDLTGIVIYFGIAAALFDLLMH